MDNLQERTEEDASNDKKLEYAKRYYQANKEAIKADQKKRQKEYQEEMKLIKQKLGVK